MKRFVLFVLAALLAVACETPSDTDNPGKSSGKTGTGQQATVSAEVKPGTATGITEISAIITGTAVIPEGLENPEAGVLVATAAGVTEDNATKYTAGAIGGNGGFSVAVSGLQPGTTYYFKTYLAADGMKPVYGGVRNFSTLDVKITVTLNDTSAFSLESATITGKVEIKATRDIPIEAKLYWGKDMNSVKALLSGGTAVPLELNADGSFSAQIGPFEPEANYAYALRASVAGKTADAFKKFVTPEREVTVAVTTEQPMMVKDTSAVLRGSYTVNVTPSFTLYYGFLYHTDSRGPEYWVQLIESGQVSPEDLFVGASAWGNSFFGRCDKLKPNTTYYYVAGVFRLNETTGDITQYWLGSVQSFTTQASSQP